MTTYYKVENKCFGVPAIHEFQVAAAVTPTYLVEITSAGKVQAHSTAGGTCIKAFATVQENIGKTISDASGSTDFIPIWFPRPGDIAVVSIKASENIAIGDLLESAGDGTLREVVADTSAGTIALDSRVGVALEATNTGSVVTIKCMII